MMLAGLMRLGPGSTGSFLMLCCLLLLLLLLLPGCRRPGEEETFCRRKIPAPSPATSSSTPMLSSRLFTVRT